VKTTILISVAVVALSGCAAYATDAKILAGFMRMERASDALRDKPATREQGEAK